jgi:inner membrane protein
LDSLTQIVLGAAVGEVVLGKKAGNKAMLWGAIAGTIPDLDILAALFTDALTATEMHRGFSHSIVFSVLMGPVLGWFIHRIYKKDKWGTLRDWQWLSFWAFITHPLLDCHTTFGTQLLWPLPYKLAFNNIFVVDPAYTLPFLVLLAVALFIQRSNPKRRVLAWTGLGLSSAYLLISLGIKWHVHQVFSRNLKEQHIAHKRLTTIPTPLNTILWNGTAETDSGLVTGTYSLLDSDQKVSFMHLPSNEHYQEGFENAEVVNRIDVLAKGWVLYKRQDDTLIINDARFGPIYTDKNKPMFGFGWKIFKQDEQYVALRQEPPRNEMKGALKTLLNRIKGD